MHRVPDKAGFDYTHSPSLLRLHLTYQMTKVLILQGGQLLELASLYTVYFSFVNK